MVNDIYADKVLTNAKIYTLDNCEHIFDSIAIKGNEILALENKEEIERFIGDETEVIDLEGKIILPSFSDTHMHPPGLYLNKMYDICLYDKNSLEEYLEVIEDYVCKYINYNDDLVNKNQFIYGMGWVKTSFYGIEKEKGPRKYYLDNITKDIGIVLYSYDGHCAWLNSKAFEMLGIDKYTTDSNIEKDENGELWGCIKEESLIQIPKKQYSKEQYIEAFEAYQQEMYSYGITNIVSLYVDYISGFFNLDAYKHIIEEDKLNIRISYVEYISPENYKSQINKIAYERENKLFNSPLFKIVGTKILLDGVIDYKTAYLTSLYEKQKGEEQDNYGHIIWTSEELTDAIIKSNENQLQCHIHCIGDGATKQTLDSIVQAKNKLKEKELINKCRNVLIHLQLVRKRDIKRIAKLGVLTAVQPFWYYKTPGFWEEIEYKNIGERAEYEYPLKSLLDADVFLTASSDYPATPVPNPINAIQIGATRNIVDAKSYGLEPIKNIDDERYLLNKFERISVIDLINMFTKNGAYLTFRENEIGTLEKGKKADFIVLNQDILEIDLLDIEKTKVVMTYFNGKLVYKLNI